MELWDIYDIDRQKTGKLCRRVDGKALADQDYHLVVHICLFNPQGQLLIQRRQLDKAGYPGLWDVTAAGSALAGVSSAQAAARELFEEMGIRHDFTNERPAFTVNFPDGFDDVYLIQTPDIALSALRLQTQEVMDASWATLPQILQLLKEDKFVPYYPQLVQLWFAMKGRFGSTTHE